MMKSVKICLCLVTASGIAAGVFAYPTDAGMDGVFGAGVEGCKDPCDDTWITSVTECDDVAGIPPEDQTANGCHGERCTINSLRYLECTPEADAADEAEDCEIHTDNNDWQRWIIVREMPCTDGGEFTKDYGECGDSGGFDSSTTPCHSSSCNGPIYMGIDRAENMGRSLCGPDPAA